MCTQTSVSSLQLNRDLWVSELTLSLSRTLLLWFSSFEMLKLISLNFQLKTEFWFKNWRDQPNCRKPTEACLRIQKEQAPGEKYACNRAEMVQDSHSLSLYLSSYIYWFIMCCVPPSISPFASARMTHSLQSLLASGIAETGLKLLQFSAFKPYSSDVINQNMRHIILSHLVCQTGMKQWVTKPAARVGGTSENKSGYGQSLDIPELIASLIIAVVSLCIRICGDRRYLLFDQVMWVK